MKGSRAAIVIACLWLGWPVAPAQANTIYRCDGDDGSRSYVSKRIPGARCAAVSSFSRARPAAPASAAPAVSAAPATAPDGEARNHAMPGASRTVVTATPPPPALPLRPAGPVRLRQGQVYSYEKDGVRHYTSARPRGVQASAVRTIQYSFLETCYACAASPGVNFGAVRLNTTAYAAEVSEAARQFGVEEAVVRAIMHAESAFNPNALSRAGAQGLMQLMPATARRFGVINAYDPAQNIRGGVEYLAWLLKRFKGDLTLAAAGYNAGEGAVDRHKGVPPYSETQRYVQRVAVLAERYRGHLAAN